MLYVSRAEQFFCWCLRSLESHTILPPLEVTKVDWSEEQFAPYRGKGRQGKKMQCSAVESSREEQDQIGLEKKR